MWVIRKLGINIWIHKLVQALVLIKHSSHVISKDSSPRLFFGIDPIKNIHYFSKALSEAGYLSNTVVKGFFLEINQKNDYDLYKTEIIHSHKLNHITPGFLKEWLFIDYCLASFDIFHISLNGVFFDHASKWFDQALLLKKCGKKIIILPYGSDGYSYSKVKSASIQHALLLSYPELGRMERQIESQKDYWSQHADAIIPGFACIDGFSRWDMLPCSYLSINTQDWQAKKSYSHSDGNNGQVTVAHFPNHRGFKGTEFIIDAVNRLKKEGFKINFILFEGVKNLEVKRVLHEEVDILVEQLVFCGYALSGIEGMVSGVPIMSNLDDENYTRLFRRYSYLNECPAVSTVPETVYNNLKILVSQPQLRKQLGQAGRAYVEKYHSEKNVVTMFDTLYQHIWNNNEVDLLSHYHPLKPTSYNNQSPLIEHPLIENKLPTSYLK